MQYGLIGEKLGHSFSKTVHNLLADYEYELKEIEKCDIEKFIKEKNFRAINVTIPYKETVIEFLDFIDDIALEIGAVNTIVNKDGKLYGYNTDFQGLKLMIEKSGIEIKDKKVLILGNGGTSKTAFAVMKYLNAKQILKVSRTKSDNLITYSEAIEKHSDAEIIVNTTPVGMYKNIGVAPIDIENFKNLCGVVDVVYNPLKSALVTQAKKLHIKSCSGLYMLVAQAVFAQEKFLDREIPKSEIDRVYFKILRDKKNIVLIGMPSCGKSTVGKKLAFELNKDFFDSDSEIEKLTNMSISQIFSDYGEEHFREIESMVIANLALKQSCVIATGGGVVLNKRNIDLLSENSFIVFLDRNIDKLIATSDRPLSSTKEALKKRYEERYDIYCKSADYIIDAGSSVEENISKIKEGFFDENSCN